MSSGSDAPILDYLQAQILLESTIASFAARRRTDGDLRLIKDRLVLRGEWKLGRQRSEFFERDRLFHESISVASHNPPLSQIHRTFVTAERQRLRLLVDVGISPGMDFMAHNRIYSAIADQDSVEAENAVRNMFASLLEFVATDLK